MLAAIAFCPSPPLLVPEVAAGAAAELAGLRAACAEAVRRLLGAGPSELVVVGAGPRTGRFPPGTTGSLGGYGVPLTATLPTGPDLARHPPTGLDAARDPDPAPDPDPTRGADPARNPAAGPIPAAGLPAPLTLGAWLLDGAPVRAGGLAVGPDADPAALAAALPDGGGLLVMGDGSARRDEKAPGYVDPRAAGFDAAVARALRDADPAALRDLDPALGADLLAAGVPGWRVAGHAAAGRAWTAELLHDAAPYGVGYLVAAWT